MGEGHDRPGMQVSGGAGAPGPASWWRRALTAAAILSVAIAASFSAAWLLGKSKWVSMAFNTSWVITAGAILGVMAVYFALKSGRRPDRMSVAAARALSGAIIAAGTVSVVVSLFTQRFVADTIAIMVLEGLRLRGLVPTEIAAAPALLVTLAGAVIGMVWGAQAWREQQRAFAAMGDAAPKRLVSAKQVLMGAAAVTAGVLTYNLAPGVREWVDTAIDVLARGDIGYVRDYLRGFGVWAPVVSAVLMILQSIAAPLPAFVVTFANGLLFGWAWGALLSWSSAMGGAALCFWLARALGRPAVERLAGGSTGLEVSDLFFQRYGDRAVLIARLLPFVSFDIISYGAGLTSMGFWRFFIATGIGQLPATIVYSYLGQNLTGSVRVLFLVFLFTAIVFVVAATVRPLFMKRITREVAEEGRETSEGAA